jgi:hypothetical protein
MRKTAATSDRQRTRKPLFYRHTRPAATTDQAPDRLCKQEVAGSIPAGSIRTVVWDEPSGRRATAVVAGERDIFPLAVSVCIR